MVGNLVGAVAARRRTELGDLRLMTHGHEHGAGFTDLVPGNAGS
jgi:hypothetical protein